MSNIIGGIRQTSLIIWTKANKIIILSIDSFISILTLSTSLFSSVVCQRIVFFCKTLIEVKFSFTKRRNQFFTYTIMILRISVKTSMTSVCILIKSVTKLIMSNIWLETLAFINTSFEFRGIILEIVSIFTNITLWKRCSFFNSTIFNSFTTSYHLEEGVSQRSITWFAF